MLILVSQDALRCYIHCLRIHHLINILLIDINITWVVINDTQFFYASCTTATLYGLSFACPILFSTCNPFSIARQEEYHIGFSANLAFTSSRLRCGPLIVNGPMLAFGP